MLGEAFLTRWAPSLRKKTQPRVLWVASEYHPRVGGLERLTEMLLSELSGQAVTGLVTDVGQYPKPEENVVHVGALNLKNCRTVPEFERAASELELLCRQFSPDVIHLANGGLACFAPLLQEIAPLFCTVHCKDITAPWQCVPGADVSAAIASGLELCAKVFCVSDYARTHLAALSPGARAETLTPGLPAAFLRGEGCSRSRFTPSGGTPRILTVARLTLRKGHFQLLDALETIDQPFIWDIVGDGPLWDELESRVDHSPFADRIVMHGSLTDDQMALLFPQCDVFALTPVEIVEDAGGRLDAEGFGLVYLEAAAYGKPSIGSLIGGSREAIADGQTGFAVDPFDREMLAAALARLLHSLSLRQSMGTAALRRLKRDFRLEDRAAFLGECYRSQKLTRLNSKSELPLLS